MEVSFGAEVEDKRWNIVQEVEVLSCNIDSVFVFKLCYVEAIGGMGFISMGISPQQILAAVQLRRLDPSRWQEIADDVVYMGRVIAEIRNERNKPRENAQR